MFNKKFYITIVTIIILISSVSCNKVTPPDDGKLHKNHSLLIGEWLDSNMQYGENKYIYDGQNFISTFDGANTYSITVEEISWTSDTEGFIYGKYTEAYQPSDVGKYYAVSFKDLTDTTISIAGAYDSATQSSSADSLDDAKTKFTIANDSFSQYSSCNKQ